MSESEPTGPEHPLTVLIVEDDANLRAALAALVTREGVVAQVAETLEELAGDSPRRRSMRCSWT